MARERRQGNGHDACCFCGCGNGERANGRVVPGKQKLGVYGTDQYRRGLSAEHRGPQHEQYRDDDVVVKVRSGYSYDYDDITTDIHVYPRDGSGDHIHETINSRGETIFEQWRHGKRKQ